MRCTKSEKLYLLELFKDIFNENNIEIVTSYDNYRELDEPMDPEHKIYDVIRVDTNRIICKVVWTPAEYRVYLKWRAEHE